MKKLLSKCVLVTFIYSKAMPFFDELIDSINNQTLLDFEVLIFNDDVLNPEFLFKKLEVNYKVINLEKGLSPSKIRYVALDLLKDFDYDFVVFQDCDDCLGINRISVVSTLLSKYELVVNDLDITDIKGNLIEHNIWSKRFSLTPQFNYKDIENHNFIGLSNTSISKRLLKYVPKYPTQLFIATDWYLFYNILKSSKVIGCFTSKTTTKYRQHKNNTIGISGNADLKKIILTKKIFHNITKQSSLKYKINTKDQNIPKKIKNNFPFWWELENYVKKNKI